MKSEPTHVADRVREACREVAEEAGSVRIAHAQVESYSRTLATVPPAPPDPTTQLLPDEGVREDRAAFVICLDAINFGSGWWPTIRKRPGRSGYATIAAGLTERFRARGGWTAEELVGISAEEVAGVVGQEPRHPLMALYAEALRDVGDHVAREHGGGFTTVIDSAGGSALVLADHLSTWRAFADSSPYRGRPVPLFKRAQLAAADAQAAGLAELAGLARLTAFADNLVPHVLRLDGLLELDQGLVADIEAGRLLEHDSPAEVELRACTVHAIELISEALGGALTAAEIDSALWHRGRDARYKALPRPRCRTTAY